MDSTNANHTARGFNFFPPRSLRLMGALGKTTPHAQNSTFAIPIKKSGCKRAVFLPTHPFFVDTFVLFERFRQKMIKKANTLLLIPICLLTMLFISINSFGQIPAIKTPTPATMTPGVTIGTNPTNTGTQIPNMPNYNAGKSIERTNREIIERDMKEHEARQAGNIDNIIDSEATSSRNLLMDKLHSDYVSVLDNIKSMLDGQQPLDINKALFMAENVYVGNTMDYNQYQKSIDDIVSICKAKMQQEGYNPNDNMAKNLVLFQYFADTLRIKNAGMETITETYPMKYDFDDYMGNEDWTKTFVTKLLATHSGQCRSLPALYLGVAQKLGAEAYMSFSPMHSYIKFKNNKGRWYNLELTNGIFVSDAAILESGFIKSEAINSKIYMDTINVKQTVSHVLFDLAKGHMKRFGPDDFALECANTALKYFPNDIFSLQLKSDLLTLKSKYIAQEQNLKSKEEAEKNQSFMQVIGEMKNTYNQIDKSGYEAMPPAFYEAWLRSLQQAKNKTEHQTQYFQFKKTVISK